ncbi:MAG: phosphoribosylformylglycinamidine synthase I [Candidatus Velthaea sp.]|jgi:phosphoribosylformylglycinamidine synthase
MSAQRRVAVLVFPGTNSEDETLRALRAAGAAAELVHYSRGKSALGDFGAYVLPGGFAYEDRVRAGAVAAHDELTDAVIAGAQAGKFVLGICNGAQILLEAGLVPGTAAVRRPTAAFTPNLPGGRFQCKRVYIRPVIDSQRMPILADLPAQALPVWVANGEGRLQAMPAELTTIERDGHLAFVYCDAGGARTAAPNGSRLDAAGLVDRSGRILALMPHPERDAHSRIAVPGGAAFFSAFVRALERSA